MKMANINSIKCKRIRTWLHKVLSGRLGPDAEWIQNHITCCPRCQRRIALFARVNLALSIIKSQPQKLDLLRRANTEAIEVLKHSLRETPKAQKLKTILPQPKLLEKCGKYTHSATNVAACITILLLMKFGIFSSIDKFQTKGQEALKQYYAAQAGEDLANEIFTA